MSAPAASRWALPGRLREGLQLVPRATALEIPAAEAPLVLRDLEAHGLAVIERVPGTTRHAALWRVRLTEYGLEERDATVAAIAATPAPAPFRLTPPAPPARRRRR